MPRRYKPCKSLDGYWSNRELMDLATGIQKYGFADLKKISSLIKTKSPTAVKIFIQHKTAKYKKEKNKQEKLKIGRKVQKYWYVRNPEDVKNWKPVCKWKKIAENQMPYSSTRQDYSRVAIKKLCEKFYNEAEETTNPQVLDVKSIYKFMLECVSGEAPSQLSIKESAYVLSVLQMMKEMFKKYDFKEEHDFIQKFRKPVEFVPARGEDEFKKNKDNPGTVPIPRDLFKKLTCHQQVVRSFNPLGIPTWLLAKEQKYVKEMLGWAERTDLLSTSTQNK